MMFKEQQRLRKEEMMKEFLKYEFPKMYETHPELIWMFTMEYTDVNGFETSEDLMCHIQSRLMEHFDEGETE